MLNEYINTNNEDGVEIGEGGNSRYVVVNDELWVVWIKKIYCTRLTTISKTHLHLTPQRLY